MTRFIVLISAFQLASLVTFVLVPTTAEAYTTTARISLKMRSKSPNSFYFNDRLRSMDRGRLLYLGQGIKAERHLFHFLRMRDRKWVSARAPIAEMLTYNSSMLGSGNRVETLTLMFYDSTSGDAGLQLVLRSPVGTRRLFYLHWDLRRQRITSTFTMSSRHTVGGRAKLVTVGFVPSERTFYFAKLSRNYGSKTIRIFRVQRGQLSVISTVRHHRRIKIAPVFDMRTRRAIIVEYADKPLRGPAPRGFIFDLRRRSSHSIALPVTAYGVAFQRRGTGLFVYSSQLGELHFLDARTGHRRRVIRSGVNGHALAYVGPNKLALLRNNQVLYYDASTLRRLGTIATKKFFSGFVHVSGSTVLPGYLVIKNGSLVKVIRVGKKLVLR